MTRLRRAGSYYTETREREHSGNIGARGHGHTVMAIAVLRPYDAINAFELWLGWPPLS
jgi:hypothetical protein